MRMAAVVSNVTLCEVEGVYAVVLGEGCVRFIRSGAGCGGRVCAAAYLASGLGWMWVRREGWVCRGGWWSVLLGDGLMGVWFAISISLVSTRVHCSAALLRRYYVLFLASVVYIDLVLAALLITLSHYIIMWLLIVKTFMVYSK